MKARVIGVLVMENEEGEDPKILSVPISDPRFDGFNDLDDVHPHKLREIQELYEVYKRLEPKKRVTFKAWRNAAAAKKIIIYAMKLYGQRETQEPRTRRQSPATTGNRTRKEIELGVDGNNLRALKLYRKFGFKVTKTHFYLIASAQFEQTRK